MTLGKDQPIRFLYLHGDQLIGGAKHDLLTIVNGLDRRRVEPIVACPGGSIGLSEALERAQVCFMPIAPLPGWRKGNSIPFLPGKVFQLYRLLVREHVALLHVNDYWWAPHCLVAAKLAGVACVVHVRLALEVKRIRQYWLAKPDCVIACSQNALDVLRKGGVPESRVKLIYAGLPANWKERRRPSKRQFEVPFQKKPGERVIGTIARLTPRKGIEDLLHAFHMVCKRWSGPLKLVIVGGAEEGNAEYARRMRELANHLGVNDHVVFAGHQETIEPLLAVMDVFVLAARSEETGPLVLLEAMAMALPVVATRVGGIPELVVDGETGYIVPPRDPRILAETLLTLLHDASIRKRFGLAGQERVLAQFTADRAVASLMNFYREVLGSRD